MTPPTIRKKSSSAAAGQQQNFTTLESQQQQTQQQQQRQQYHPQQQSNYGEPIAKRLRVAQPTHQGHHPNSLVVNHQNHQNHHHHHNHKQNLSSQPQYLTTQLQQQQQQNLYLSSSFNNYNQKPQQNNPQQYHNSSSHNYHPQTVSFNSSSSANLVSFVSNSGPQLVNSNKIVLPSNLSSSSSSLQQRQQQHQQQHQQQQQQTNLSGYYPQLQQHLLQPVNSNQGHYYSNNTNSGGNSYYQHPAQQQQLYSNNSLSTHNHHQSKAQLIPQEDMYFFKNNENSSDFSKKRARQFFNTYTSTSSDPDLIEPEGIEKLCTDLQLKTDDPLVLVLSWKLKAKVMGVYTFAEWLEGMAELKCDTLPKLRNKLSYLQSCLNDPAQFKSIFRYSFEFAKENDQRCLDMAVARQMLAILLAPRWRLFPLFNEFLSTVKYRVLNKDQYYNVLDFSRTVDDDLLNYDEESAWPVIMDEFVEYCREKGFPSPSSKGATQTLKSSPSVHPIQSSTVESSTGNTRSGDSYGSRRESR